MVESNLESIKNYVILCYKNILKRNPDDTGLSHFVKEIQENRIQKEDLETIFKQSDEYQNLKESFCSYKTNGAEPIQDVTIESELTLNNNFKNLSNLKDYLYNLQIIPGREDELHDYVNEAFYRFVKTLQMIPFDNQGNLLEIGSNPYFMTTLLSKFRKFELHGANFFSTSSNTITQKVVNEKYNERFIYTSKLFNIETETFPYENSSFDCVLFCEVLEHLVKDPIHTLKEIHRILKPEGVMILTTPNVARVSNIERLKNNENIYDPYSSYGIYGRHNREYTTKELDELLSHLGFNLLNIFTKFVHIERPDRNWWNLSEHDDYHGDYIFIKAKKHNIIANYRPSWLFR